MKLFLTILLSLALFPVAYSQIECIKGDCKNGYGTCLFPSGSKYVGNFTNGKINGKGILYFSDGHKYIGHWENQYRQGEGKMIFANGDEYFGNFNKSKFEGYGEMLYANGNHYEGNWSENKPNGNGTFTFANGDRYEGQLIEGQFHGEGIMFYADGTKYKGGWYKNKKHGRGYLAFQDGDVIRGEWSDDQYLADWHNFAFNGDTSLLIDCNNNYCAEGNGKFRFRDGTRYVGAFQNGQPTGKGTVYYVNGDKYEGFWQGRTPHGKGIMYFCEGNVLGAVWENGRPVKKLFVENDGPDQAPVLVERNPQTKIWAVVVGAARYRHMPTLRYTDDDAYQVFAFLKSPEGGALRDEQVKLLIDEDATRENILGAMRSTFLKADENDVVLFYFSGHGLKGSFLPVDFDGANNTLRHEELSNLLKASRAKHKLVLADACHSGSLLAKRSALTGQLKDYYSAFDHVQGGTALLMSSKGEEYSLEDGGLRSGVFSHFLVKGLKGGADLNGDKVITIEELFNFVHQNVRTYTGNVQTPTLTGDYDAKMPVALVRD